MKKRSTLHFSGNNLARGVLACTAVLLAALLLLPVNGAFAKYKAEVTTKAEVHFKKDFTITFDFNGIFPRTSKDVSYGEPAEMPDIGLYSVQTISYYKDGSTQPRYVESDSSGVHMFDGWYKDAACTEPYDNDSPVTSDLTVFAKWSDVVCLSFDMKGHGPALSSVYMDKDMIYPLPLDTWSSAVSGIIGTDTAYADENDSRYYVFGGWRNADGASFQGDSVVISEDTTIFAAWTPVYTVSFDTSGKCAAPSAQSIVSGCSLPEPTLLDIAGISFLGWKADPGADAFYDFSSPVVGDLTLYAAWADIPTVSFDMMGHGDAIPAQTVLAGQTAVKPDDPVADHQRFDGWYLDSDATRSFDFSTPITKSITLYAHWTPLYDVTYDVGGIGVMIT